MGRIVPYQAAMQRVLHGLECHDELTCCESDSEDGGGGSQEDRAADRAGRLGRLASRFARATGTPITPDELQAKCKAPDGEFHRLREELMDAVVRYCERNDDWAPLEAIEDGDFDGALETAAGRLAAGLSAVELGKAKTLPMLILKVAHRIATRPRAAAASGGAK